MSRAPASPLALLHIEDDDDDASLFTMALRRAGLAAEVVRVDSESAMRAALSDRRFDAIVSDHSLPSFGARRALEIHAELGLDVPFVVVSGAVGEEAAVALMRAGARDFVPKKHLDRLPEVLRREIREAHRRAELRETEQALAREREAAARYLAIIPMLVLATDREGRITLCNEGGQQLLGATQEELLGRSVFELLAVREEREATERVFADAMQGGVLGMPDAELTLTSLRGERRRIRYRTVVVRDAAGVPTGTLNSAEDITEREALEERLRRAQKLDALGRLAAATAHDFNNVLTVILANAELAKQPVNPEESTEIADTIVQAAMRGADLTRQLLAFARQQPAERRPIDLAETIEPTARMVRRLLADRIDFRVALTPGARIVGDAGQIDQIVMNLVVNARDAMPEGGALVLEVERVDVDALVAERHGRPGGRYVVVRVKDSGHGIAPGDLARIFEPFFTTKQPGHGTGIGLATVASIVDKHRGFVVVESEVGVGTTFAVHLPETSLETAAPERASISKPPLSVTALVVDDSLPVRRAVTQLLRREGHRTLGASSAEEAREVFRTNPEIEMLVSDVWIGGGDTGIHLLAAIRAERPRLPAVIMSGDVAVLPTFDDERTIVLRKPFRHDELVTAVRRAVLGVER